ncbi:MAG: GNAT family N-acetyltransferase [Clostridia bacterium]|nr:GNAT family N-acetyltransferase [Clostridia bacterium]
MKYWKEITLKDGRKCILRNADENDAQAVLDIFTLTHEQTDYLLTYPDEKSFSIEDEQEFLKSMTESEGAIEIIAILDGKVIGCAGFSEVGRHEKQKHRAEFGISVDKAFWGLGVGGELTKACIELAKKAGYVQLELDVVGDNSRAMALYEKYGFREYGRNPKGFKSRTCGYQELVLMRLEF